MATETSEARFTAPRPECPHPEWWNSEDVDSTELEVSEMVGSLIRGLQPELCLETGTAWGQTALHIGNALKANGHGTLVTLEIDTHRVDVSRRKLADLPVQVLQTASTEYWPPGPLDFCWFDSLLDLRHIEFERFYPYMHARTIVGFHDTGVQHEVRHYIDQLAVDGLLRPIYLGTPRGVCFAQVLGRPFEEDM